LFEAWLGQALFRFVVLCVMHIEGQLQAEKFSVSVRN
jgi:hypothetical protein